MKWSLIRLFIWSAGLLLLVTGLAKVVSGFGDAEILNYQTPILYLPFRWVFLIVGLVELAIGLTCFLNRNDDLCVMLLAWLTTNFLLYRIAVVWIGYIKPCPCLGNLTDRLHIPANLADFIMKIILGYLLVGAYVSLFWLQKQKRSSVVISS